MPNTPSSSPPLLALSSWELLLPHMPWVFSTLHHMQCTICERDWLAHGLRSHSVKCKAYLNTLGDMLGTPHPEKRSCQSQCRQCQCIKEALDGIQAFSECAASARLPDSHRQHCGVVSPPLCVPV